MSVQLPEDIVENYLENKHDSPINKRFFEHGQDVFLEAITKGIKKSDDKIINTLEFVLDSLRNYKKSSWNESLTHSIQSDVGDLIRSSNYFIRKSVVDFRQLLAVDQDGLEELYKWLQEVFKLQFDLSKDPLLLYHIFSVLNTRNGGTWVYDYEIEMISVLFKHPSKAMKIAGIGCFEIMNPDMDEVPEELFQNFKKLKEQYDYDFFGLALEFESSLKTANQTDYTMEELDLFIAQTYTDRK